MSERGQNGRGTLRQAMAKMPASRMPIATVAKAMRAADQARHQAKQHYEKHKDAWAQKRYGDLVSKQGRTLTLAPPGNSNDPAQVLMSRARSEVAGRQSARLERIEKAKENMAASGQIRSSRRMNWSKGLGE
jgi:hypothetical protein